MVETLRIGPYALRVVPLYAGPLLEAKGEAEALARLLNHAVEGPTTDLADAIETGHDGSDPIVYVTPSADDEDDRALRDAWAARTGERLGSRDVAHVGQTGLEGTLPVSWAALREGLADLRAIRAAWRPEPGPWLFVRPTRYPFVTPEDFEIITRLEREAAAIDELDLQAEVGREPTTLIVRRRAFILACREAGVFASDHGQVREQWLYNWSAHRLLALRESAVQLRAWGFLAEGEEPPVGPVCLDYVRHKLWSAGEDGANWARSALKLLPPAAEGDQGVILENVGGATIRVWWRRDGERPALLAIARG
jgi:hypothetical protein